jgi:hypothetical protein
MNGELLDGMVDGTFKRIRPDHSNYKAPDLRLELEDRMLLNRGGNGFGLYEATVKRTPDGRFVRDSGVAEFSRLPG